MDAVICPVAPHAACIPGKYATIGYTAFINVLDYTSAVVPVTCADRGVDVLGTEGREYFGELDRKTEGECKFFLLFPFHFPWNCLLSMRLGLCADWMLLSRRCGCV